MAVVRDMITFPLKFNVPNMNSQKFQPISEIQQTHRPILPITTTLNPLRNSNILTTPLPDSFVPTNNPSLNNGEPNFVDPNVQDPNSSKKFGTKINTNEGDFEINSENQKNDSSGFTDTLFTSQPIYISSLGELSTDLGDRFDINKVRLIPPADNKPIPEIQQQNTKAIVEEDAKSLPITSTTQNPNFRESINSGEGDSLSQSLIDSLKKNNNLALQSGEVALLNQLQNIPTVNIPGAIDSGENDLLQSLIRSQQNNAPGSNIYSGENDLLQQILNKNRGNVESSTNGIANVNQFTDHSNPIESEKNNNQFKNAQSQIGGDDLFKLNQDFGIPNANGNTFSGDANRNQPIAVESGESDLLQTIKQIIQLRKNLQLPQSNVIFSGESDLLLQIVREAVDKRKTKGLFAVESGESDLLETFQQILREDRSKIAPTQDLETPVYSGESDLLLQTVNEALEKQKSASNIGQGAVAVESGEANLLEHLQIIVKHRVDEENRLKSIYSGQSDLISNTLTSNGNHIQGSNGIIQQTNPVLSGESNLLQSLQQNQQNNGNALNQAQPVPNGNILNGITSGQKILLHSIQPNKNISTSRFNAIASGQGNGFYQFTNGNRNRAGILDNSLYRDGVASNKHLQSNQNQFSNNVYSGNGNIYTESTFSQQTRSQSTSSNTQQFHYKFTESTPYEIPSQAITSNDKLSKTYIPPYPTKPSYGSQAAPKQIFTYPVVRD